MAWNVFLCLPLSIKLGEQSIPLILQGCFLYTHIAKLTSPSIRGSGEAIG